jgi:hypothetical protein
VTGNDRTPLKILLKISTTACHVPTTFATLVISQCPFIFLIHQSF